MHRLFYFFRSSIRWEKRGGTAVKRDVCHVQQKAKEALELLLRDGTAHDADDLKRAVEQLTRAIYDLTVVLLLDQVDAETTLQATKAKMQIVRNLLEKATIANR
jgi:hypothetical protein